MPTIQEQANAMGEFNPSPRRVRGDFDVGKLERIGLASDFESQQTPAQLAPEIFDSPSRVDLDPSIGADVVNTLFDLGEDIAQAKDLGTGLESDLAIARKNRTIFDSLQESLGFETVEQKIEREILTEQLEQRLEQQNEESEERLDALIDATDSFADAISNEQQENLFEQLEESASEEQFPEEEREDCGGPCKYSHYFDARGRR